MLKAGGAQILPHVGLGSFAPPGGVHAQSPEQACGTNPTLATASGDRCVSRALPARASSDPLECSGSCMVRRSFRPTRACQVLSHQLLTMSTPCARNMPRDRCCLRLLRLRRQPRPPSCPRTVDETGHGRRSVTGPKTCGNRFQFLLLRVPEAPSWPGGLTPGQPAFAQGQADAIGTVARRRWQAASTAGRSASSIRWCCRRKRRRCRRGRTSPRERPGRGIQIGTADGQRPHSRGNVREPGVRVGATSGRRPRSPRKRRRTRRRRFWPGPGRRRHRPAAASGARRGGIHVSAETAPRLACNATTVTHAHEASLSIRPATSQTPLAGRISLAGCRTAGSPSGQSAMVPCGPFDHVSGAHWNSPEGGAGRLRGDS